MSKAFRIAIVSKRQATIPQPLLDLLHLAEGDVLEVIVDHGRVLEVRPLKLMRTDLFPPEVLQKLDAREAEIDSGAYNEPHDVSALRQRHGPAAAAAAGAAAKVKIAGGRSI